MKQLRVIALFTAGFLFLATALIVAWLGSPGFQSATILRWLMVGLGIVLSLMLALGVRARGRERWAAFSLVSVLLLAFSGFAIFSFWLFTAPIALIWLALSLWKLLASRPPDRARLNNVSGE